MQRGIGSDVGRRAASNSYYEIAINPAGTVLEIDHGKDGKDVAWTSGAQFAVHRGAREAVGEGEVMGADCIEWHRSFYSHS